MNQRIKEIADQIFSMEEFEYAEEFLNDAFMAKFAELVVKECAERLMQDDFGSVKGVMSIAGARLKEHFGVEG